MSYLLKTKAAPAAPPAKAAAAGGASSSSGAARHVVLADHPAKAPEGRGARPAGIPSWGDVRKAHPRRSGETKSTWNLRLRGVMADLEKSVRAAGASSSR